MEADDRTADVPHTYANLSGAPARALLVITPAGFERYFARIGVERQDVKPLDWVLRPIPRVSPDLPPISYGYGLDRAPVERLRGRVLTSGLPPIRPIC